MKKDSRMQKDMKAYYAVSDSDGNWGFADEAGENVIPCQYVDAYSFSNQTAAVQYAGKWGYINQYGNMVINAEYSEALPFLNGKAFAYDDQGNIEVLELKYFELF